MTESELATKPLPPNQINRHFPQHYQQQYVQQQQQIGQQQPCSSLLLQPNCKIDLRSDNSVQTTLINNLETNYHSISAKIGRLSQPEALEFLSSSGSVELRNDPGKAKNLCDGLLCGILVDPANANKYINCLDAIVTDQWMAALTSVNMILLELYPQLRSQCRQQLLQFFNEAMKLGVRLESILSNFCRSLSDGSEFRETSQMVHQFAQILLNNRKWFGTMPKNSMFPGIAFALFSRFISDAIFVGNTGVMSPENFKAPLIAACEILLRERFPDLMMMGRDLVLSLMRLSRIPQFIPIWRSLIHNPASLMPNFSGLKELLATPTNIFLLGNRVSLRISRKMDEILKTQVRAASSMATAPSPVVAATLRQQHDQTLNRLFDSLKNAHLSGPDSGSIRAEIIRHVWAVVSPKEFNAASIDARANFLDWLLRTAKPGAEMQWCKLVFFWEWYGFENTQMNAQINAEPVFSTLKHVFNTGNIQLGNSLVDFLMKSANLLYTSYTSFFINSIMNAMKALEMANFQVQATFMHSRLDPRLKDELRIMFQDFFPKRLTSIADNLAEPSSIIDFDAIRNTSNPTTPVATTNSKSTTLAESSGVQLQQHTSTSTLNEKQQHATSTTTASATLKPKSEPKVPISGEKLITDAAAISNTTINEPQIKRVKLTKTATTNTSETLPLQKKKPKLLSEELKNVKSNADNEVLAKRKKLVKEENVKNGVGIGTSRNIAAKTAFPANEVRPCASNSIEASRLTITIDEDDENIVPDSEESSSGADQQGTAAEQSTSKRMPLSLLLPMLPEEFREPLEQLNKAVNKRGNTMEKRQQTNNDDSEDEDPVGAMQKWIDNVFDADEIDDEQTEYIALCLLRIFDDYLQKKKYYENGSDESFSDIMEQPIYRFFKVLCQSAEQSDSRKHLLGIATKMHQECARIGYLFLWYLSSIDNSNDLLSRSSRGNGPSVEQAVAAYKDICKSVQSDWDKVMVKDLEQCSFDDYALFGHVLVNVLAKITPYGPPARVLRFICGAITPVLLSRLMSEVIRENIVLFSEENVLQLLVESLKWDSLEQLMLWQLLQTEAVQFDKFLDLLQRLSYANHPEATAGVIVIMRNMEPNPEMSVMRSLLRNLFLRQPTRDLFTVDAIKLLIDYDENVSPVADCIAKMIKKTMQTGDISAQGGRTATKGKRVLTLESIFGHLDRLRQNCMDKESLRVEELLKNPLILDAVMLVKKNARVEEVRSRYDELFALFDILLEEDGRISSMGNHAGKHGRKAGAKSTADMNSRDATPTKKKKAKKAAKTRGGSTDSEEDET